MPRFGLVGPAYQAQSVNADAQRCVNWYPERDESGQGRSEWQLYETPGLKLYADLNTLDLSQFAMPTPPVGALFAHNGDLLAFRHRNNNFGVGYSCFFYHWHSSGRFTGSGGGGVGTVPALENAAVATLAASQTQLVAAGGGSVPQVYNFISGGVNPAYFDPGGGGPITDPVLNVQSVAYLDGYFLYLIANSNQIYFSHLNDATRVDPLDTFQVSITGDNVRAMIVDHEQLLLCGDVDIVPYLVTGDPDNPFQPDKSGFIQLGIAAAASLVSLDNTVMLIGGDRKGAGIGWRLNGYIPTRITTHAIETAWQGYSTISDAVAYPYQDQGHSFWVIYFPTANKTWVYDVATGAWHERSHLIPNSGLEEAHRSWVHTYAFGKHLVGDWKTGTIYEMHIPEPDGNGGWNFCTDFGDPIKRVRRSPHVANEGERIYVSELQVFLESGLGPMPPLAAIGDLGPLTLLQGPS